MIKPIIYPLREKIGLKGQEDKGWQKRKTFMRLSQQ